MATNQTYQPSSGKYINSKDEVINIADAWIDGVIKVGTPDIFGRNGMTSMFGDMVTSKRQTQLQGQFGYGLLNPESTIPTITGSGEIVAENSMLKVRTGTADGTANIESLQAIRYIPSMMAYSFFTLGGIQTGTGLTGTKQYSGLFDDVDGFFVGQKDGVFSIGYRRDSVDIIITQDNFNIDKLDGTGDSGLTIDPSKGNVYLIMFGYLGFAPIVFKVMDENGIMREFHVIQYPNLNTQTNLTLPYLPASSFTDNTGSGIVLENFIGSLDAGIIEDGKIDVSAENFGFNLEVVPAYLPVSTTGTDLLVAFRGAQTINGIKNKISSLLNQVSIITDQSPQDATVELIFNPTITTPGTWTAANTNSAVEFSTDTIFDLASGRSSGLIVTLLKTDKYLEFVDKLNLLLRRGEIAVFKFSSTNGSIAKFTIGYKDLF